MPFMSRKQSIIALCITLGIFLIAGIAAVIFGRPDPNVAENPGAGSLSSESSASEPVAVSRFTISSTPDPVDKIAIQAQSSSINEIPYIIITVTNNSEDLCFFGELSFNHVKLGVIDLPYLAPGCTLSSYYSDTEPPEDLKYTVTGNFYEYSEAYPEAHTALYLDGKLSGVVMDEKALTETAVKNITAYLTMDESGALPISAEIPFVPEIRLALEETALRLDPANVLLVGHVDLGEPSAELPEMSEEPDASDESGSDA